MPWPRFGAGRTAACATTMAIALTSLSTYRHDCFVTPRGVARIEKASQVMIVMSNRKNSSPPYLLPIFACATGSELVEIGRSDDTQRNIIAAQSTVQPVSGHYLQTTLSAEQHCSATVGEHYRLSM